MRTLCGQVLLPAAEKEGRLVRLVGGSPAQVYAFCGNRFASAAKAPVNDANELLSVSSCFHCAPSSADSSMALKAFSSYLPSWATACSLGFSWESHCQPLGRSSHSSIAKRVYSRRAPQVRRLRSGHQVRRLNELRFGHSE